MVGKTVTTRTTGTNSWDSGIFNARKRIKYIHVEYTSSATAGNRQLKCSVKDSSGNIVIDVHAGAVQAASLTYHYSLMPGIYRETTVTATSLQLPFPMDFIIDPNHKIVINDNNSVSGSDSMVIGYQTEEV